MFEPRDQSVAGKVFTYGGLGDFWIGIHDRYNEGTFVYESDDALLSSTNWGAGEPNDNTSGEDCVEVKIEWNGKWNDIPCTETKSYVCTRDTGKGISIFIFLTSRFIMIVCLFA